MYTKEITQFTESIWKNVLMLDIQKLDQVPAPNGSEPYMTGMISITGSWKGVVAVDLPATLARRAAAAMFGTEPDETPHDEVKDALGEVANMVGGNLKSMLSPPCAMSLPSVIEGREYEVSVPGSEKVTEVGFKCQDLEFRVVVLKQDEG